MKRACPNDQLVYAILWWSQFVSFDLDPIICVSINNPALPYCTPAQTPNPMMISATLVGVANCTSLAAMTPYRLLVTSLMNSGEGLFKSVVLKWNHQPHIGIIIKKIWVNVYIK